MEKNNSLKVSTFINYLSATILSMAAVRLANMADAALIGNIVGAEGLAGVTLCQPLMQVIFSLYTLLVLSSAVLTGMAIGKGDSEKASRLFAFGMKAAIVIGVGIFAMGYLFFDELSHVLCKSDDLRPYANAYLRVILVGAIPQMGMYAMNQFVTVDGSPQTVSRIAIAGNILNVCLDIVFMKCFGWGIAGAALATLMMYVVCVCLLLRHRFKGTYSVWRCLTIGRDHTRRLPEVLKFGLPLFLSTSLLTLQFYSNNVVATTRLGTDAMVVLAVCMQLYDLSLIILTGALSTAQPLGARLVGEGNVLGLYRMYIYIYSFLGVATTTYCVAISLLPEHIAGLLGADTPQQQMLAQQALPAFAAYLMIVPMVYLLLPAYQFYSRRMLTYVHSVSITLVPPLCFAIFSMIDKENCWWGLALGDVIVLVLLGVLTEIVRRGNRSLVPILLIEKPNRQVTK